MFTRCLYFNLNAFTRELNRQWDEEFAKLDLSPAHGYFLRLALERPGSNQKDLAQQMNLATSTLTRTVDALEKKSLLTRETCPKDARAILIQPTKKAQQLSKKLDVAMKTLGKRLTEKIGQKDGEDLLRLLEKIQTKFETGDPT